jgi:predicted nucleic acid-binding protein
MYFDTSLLAKQYFKEPESDVVRKFLIRKDEVLSSSELSRMEMAATFHRKLREGQLTGAEFRRLRFQYQDDIGKGRVEWMPLTQTIIERVEAAFSQLPANIFLRTGDAIHLATAAEAGFKEIYSNDRHLLAAASLFKLKGVNPLSR